MKEDNRYKIEMRQDCRILRILLDNNILSEQWIDIDLFARETDKVCIRSSNILIIEPCASNSINLSLRK